jgi:pimeloyl-ACP methyl ester carboxylesterase
LRKIVVFHRAHAFVEAVGYQAAGASRPCAGAYAAAARLRGGVQLLHPRHAQTGAWSPESLRIFSHLANVGGADAGDPPGSRDEPYAGSRPFDRALSTVVFVHGAAQDHGVWALQSRYFAHHGRNVVAVDLPGHGRSEGKPLPSVAAIADWIVALLDALHVERATLVGHSMGALAVLEAAGRRPERVAKLALLGPAAPMPVSDVLLEAAKRDDHVAFELINGWSFSPGDQLGGNRLPGVWMTGNAMRLMERSRPGVLYA